jgi:hypothetical protein
VLYLSTLSHGSPAIADAMRAGVFGQMINCTDEVKRRASLLPGVRWAADSGGFTGSYPGDDAYLRWLSGMRPQAGLCEFAVAPDVLADAASTRERSLPVLSRIRDAGFPAAYVLQDGSDHVSPPWQDFDVLFIGGTTRFKLGQVSQDLATEAVGRGLKVHVGRVNTLRRLRYAEAIGATSCDGTYLAFGPDKNVKRMSRWVANVRDQGALF